MAQVEAADSACDYHRQYAEGRQFAGDLVIAMLDERDPGALGEVVRSLLDRPNSEAMVDGILVEVAKIAMETARTWA